jgi:DNA-directed RNA polymerase sigma subunit (sigma70/sigma32)
MTKRIEPIPFLGMLEVNDEPYDRSVYVKTQQEVADVLGLKRSVVGYIENRALKKLRKKFLEKFNKTDFI